MTEQLVNCFLVDSVSFGGDDVPRIYTNAVAMEEPMSEMKACRMPPEQRASINMWANDIFEHAAEIAMLPDPEIEAAVQALSEAADHLSRLTQAE
jgi:hypothetical protein